MRFESAVTAAILTLPAPGHPFPTNTTAKSTYTNPMLPGWHSDPTCVFVAERDSTFFCSVSTFLAFPGPAHLRQQGPVVLEARLQRLQPALAVPGTRQLHGSNERRLRAHPPPTATASSTTSSSLEGLVFKTADPFDDAAWSDSVRFTPASIDADFFWDDGGGGGQVWVLGHGEIVARVEERVRPVVQPVPEAWLGAGSVRLRIEALNDTHYTFSAGPTDGVESERVVSQAPATVVSGGTGPFTGVLVGVYATSNGGDGKTPAYISRWRYEGKGQKISDTEIVPSTPK